jgi:hypothetical protein
MSFQPPKGTDDITAPASFQWRRLLRAWEDLAERYAYPLVLTPVFEATELFERGIGETSDVVQKQMYTFTDRGGARLPRGRRAGGVEGGLLRADVPLRAPAGGPAAPVLAGGRRVHRCGGAGG